MIIQIVLSFVFVMLVIYGLSQKNKSHGVGGFIYTSAILGCFFVWFPDASSAVANFVGVGRGADLVLYLFVVTTLVVGFSLYLKLNTCLMMITELVRHAALSAPLKPEQSAVSKIPPDAKIDDAVNGPQISPQI